MLLWHFSIFPSTHWVQATNIDYTMTSILAKFTSHYKSQDVYYVFPSHYCLNTCSAEDNCACVNSEYQALFLPDHKHGYEASNKPLSNGYRSTVNIQNQWMYSFSCIILLYAPNSTCCWDISDSDLTTPENETKKHPAPWHHGRLRNSVNRLEWCQG